MSFRWIAAVGVMACATMVAQSSHHKKIQSKSDQSGYDQAVRATVLHVANLYVMADATTQPVLTITPGHEVVVLGHNGAWVNVLANTDSKEDSDPDSAPEFQDPESNPDPSSGWIRDMGVVGAMTPHGDVLLFGAAEGFEAEARGANPPQGAAQAAHLLYERVEDYFPDSPLATAAAFRAADIRWQLEELDNATLPSAKAMDPDLRPELYEGELKRVMKMYPGTEYEARAAFDLLEAKLCGSWQGLPRCPAMESALYLQYAKDFQGGPKSAEALYDAAYRQGALVTLYMVNDDTKSADEAAKSCQTIADELAREYPKSDWGPRAQLVAYKVKQGIPVYGDDRD